MVFFKDVGNLWYLLLFCYATSFMSWNILNTLFDTLILWLTGSNCFSWLSLVAHFLVGLSLSFSFSVWTDVVWKLICDNHLGLFLLKAFMVWFCWNLEYHWLGSTQTTHKYKFLPHSIWGRAGVSHFQGKLSSLFYPFSYFVG